MSLRVRLTVAMVGMVVLAVLVLSALQINSQVSTWLLHVRERSNTTAQFVKSWILHRTSETEPPPAGSAPDRHRELWWSAVANDEELTSILNSMLVQTSSVVEISIAGEHGRIIASSNSYRIGALMQDRLTLDSLMSLGPLDRLLAILGGRIDYETRVMLGEEGARRANPVMTIQVLVSSALLRQALRPLISDTALILLLTLLLAAMLAYFAAQLALRPLARISDTIDRIAAGELELPAGDHGAAREFQAVEQKLRLLGAQYRGAQEGAVQLRSSMERRLVAINKLTGGVAHEIKNPLNSIAIRLELLKDQVKEIPEAQDQLSIIAQEITRLDRVVRTFLDFTRPVDLASENLDLTGLTSEVLTLIDPEALAAGIEIRLTRPEEALRIKGDADLLKQAILNVCKNSLDAMPTGGRLDVGLAREGNDALMTLSDTGPGIPRAERDRVFQLYYSTKKQGSGIGLAMTFRAVQLHGGTIEVAGEEGQGAEFRLRLPLAS